ncbi:serine/threonine-protein kinase [Streptomyces sp. FXJ1.172]|uniref:serine/threonine-protein kinase n=1 Tax=Streptomyces sp. FXJ1.172 TaxID=710705 RepID=UPI0007CFB86D|nr:serine/threonine-protein kinase [Streptomyces sp. FXJ1.172]WEO96089.1 serine/threonine-protein kinase [Streptomyces sp. FXJ1.172]
MTPQRRPGAGTEAELPEYAGQYRLESCLGSGGMGVVHLARSTSGLKLAVKVVHAEFARDPEFRGRFRQEVAAARRVSGAFTAPVVDADPEAERPWMATLFIPGPTLSQYVKRNGPMPAAQVRRLMAGLAEALRDIHRVGVVHRDLKPSNVLLAEDGPKVIDFGISRPKDSELRTETGKLIGTPPFMAPEQFRRPREVGPAADIFALGSVLVHAATGRGPFDSDSPYVVAYQVVHDEPDLTGVPETLAPLVLRCLAKEPEDRPTPDELMRELRSVAASYDTQAFIPAQRTGDDASARESAGADPVVEPASRRRFGKRAVRAALAGGALALALGGVLTGLLWPGGDGGPAVHRGSAPAAAARFSAWRAKPAGTGSGMPQCVYGAGAVLCFRSGLAYALDPANGRLRWRRSVAGERTSDAPAFSGGLLVLPTDGGRRVVALDPASGTPRWQRDMPAHTRGMRFTPDMLLVTGADGTVTGVSGASGRTAWHRRVAGPGVPELASYDGDPLVYAVGTDADGTHTLINAVAAGTGAARWKARLAGMLQPIGSQGGSLFLLSVDPGSGDADGVVRYTPATKAVRRIALSVPLTAPQAAVRGDVVHLLATGGSLDALDLGTGKRLWHTETSVSRGSAPVASAGEVYFTAPDGRLLAVDARDGSLVGQTPPRLGANAGEVAAVLPAPLLVGSRVYATSPDGSVFALDGSDPKSW